VWLYIRLTEYNYIVFASVHWTRLSRSVRVPSACADTLALALLRPNTPGQTQNNCVVPRASVRLGVNSCDITFEFISGQVHAVSVNLRCVMSVAGICVVVTKGLN